MLVRPFVSVLVKMFVFVLLTFISLSGYSQGEVIKWDKGIKIRWDDFKGKADMKSPFAAMSAIGIHYKYTSWSNRKVYKIKFQVYSSFNKIKSWSKGRLRTQWMLKHEQLHFDIGGLVSREFKKEAERRNYGKNYKNEIMRIFNRYTLSLQKLQRKYDEQTQHSENKMKQRE